MAFHQVNGFTPPTYESCSTAIFKYGRTETIRSATSATKKFTDMASQTSGVLPSKQATMQALQECSKLHSKIAAEASIAQGHDRHLFGLRSLVQRQGYDIPALFTDPSYAASSNFQLSTSTVGAPPFLISAAFGPVVPDGYGIGYKVNADSMGATVTSYSGRDGVGMKQALRDSWDVIHHLISS